MIIIKGGKLIKENEIVNNSFINIDDGKIKSMHTDGNGKVIDAKNYYIAPGFIDMHTHGGIGFKFETDDVDEIYSSMRKNAAFGVTSLCPALLLKNDELSDFENGILKAHSKVVENKKDVESYGLHLEGPYCNIGNEVKLPQKEKYNKILEYFRGIKIWTVMPELEGIGELIDDMQEKDIFPSLGHCRPNIEKINEVLNKGINQITHIYTGMNSVYRDANGIRRPGLVESAVLNKDLFVEVLCDGYHLDKDMVRFTYEILGSKRFCVTSDSHYRQINDGESFESVPRVELKIFDGNAALMGQMPFNEMVRFLAKDVKLPLVDAVKMSSLNPAKALKVDDRKGKIETGYDADVIIFDEDINILSVIAGGKIIINNL